MKEEKEKVSFWLEMDRLYGDTVTWKKGNSPFILYGCPVAIRRKDLAEKLVEICIKNDLSLFQALDLLETLTNPHIFVKTEFCESPIHKKVFVCQKSEPQSSTAIENLEELVKNPTVDVNEQQALRDIIRLINEHHPSFAELRGAAWEAVLMLMQMPIEVRSS